MLIKLPIFYIFYLIFLKKYKQINIDQIKISLISIFNLSIIIISIQNI